MEYASILVLTDFSDNSLKAVEAGLDLAKKYDADLTLLHVLEDKTSLSFALSDTEFHNMEKKLEKHARKALDELSETVPGFYGFPHRKKLRKGIAYIQCLEELEEGSYDLVVMASQGESDLKHMFMGSTSSKVLRRAPISVFVVR